MINDISHTFDTRTAGVNVTASTNHASCTISCPYPKSGQFSITSTLDSMQDTTSEVVVGKDIRIIVKLSSDISPDVKLPKPLKIQIDTGRLQFAEFVIPSGGAR